MSKDWQLMIVLSRLESEPAALAAGADAFVSKADPPEQLLAALRGLVRRHRGLRIRREREEAKEGSENEQVSKLANTQYVTLSPKEIKKDEYKQQNVPPYLAQVLETGDHRHSHRSGSPP